MRADPGRRLACVEPLQMRESNNQDKAEPGLREGYFSPYFSSLS